MCYVDVAASSGSVDVSRFQFGGKKSEMTTIQYLNTETSKSDQWIFKQPLCPLLYTVSAVFDLWWGTVCWCVYVCLLAPEFSQGNLLKYPCDVLFVFAVN